MSVTDAVPTTRRPPPALFVAIGLIVIGSAGEWATAGDLLSKNGLDGDGILTVILALVAAALLGIAIARKRPFSVIAVGICAFLVLVIAAYDTIDILGIGFGITVGWGLWLVDVGAVIALAATVAARRAR